MREPYHSTPLFHAHQGRARKKVDNIQLQLGSLVAAHVSRNLPRAPFGSSWACSGSMHAQPHLDMLP